MANKYKDLILEDRTLIQTQLQQGFKLAAIAAGLNSPRSCITRELARNGWERPAAIIWVDKYGSTKVRKRRRTPHKF
jgi:IS30 family transposase